MDVSALGLKLAAAKGYIGAVVLVGGLYIALTSFTKVPGQLAAHQVQADSMIAEQRETNSLLRKSLCIQAKIDTPLGCVLKTK